MIAQSLLLVALAAPPADAARPIHWAVALGLRVEQVNRAFPVVDQVVLVPDEATYLDELSRWSPRGRWPVLIEDDQLAAMFIRRFRPARVIRRDAVAPAADRVTRQQVAAVVVRAWGGEPPRDTIAETFRRAGHVPPGVVIASVEDPAWTAAVALAAGRGQPIGWLDDAFGNPDGRLEAQAARALKTAIDTRVAEAGYAYDRLGDAIDTITLCRAVSGRIKTPAPNGKPGFLAVTDVLGRHGAGDRYALAGWIFGSPQRCAYVAMCALFAGRQRFLLVDTYPDQEPWNAYAIAAPARTLSRRGYDTVSRRGPEAALEPWLAALAGGWGGDVLVMNSKGNADFFEVADGRAYPGDVPVLNEPLAVHFIHSFSMRTPRRPGTVGGRWLRRGVYAYAGSVDEPTLGAFMTPETLVARWTAGVPFLVSARRWVDDGPWKINTFGDPLMVCRPPCAPTARLGPPADHDGLDLKNHAANLLRQVSSDDTGAVLAEAIRTLELLGQDAIAVRMWRLAGAHQRGAAAGPILGVLFRAGGSDEFVAAWRLVPDPDPRAVDMLWHLMTPRLAGADAGTLRLMASSLRDPQVEADLERLVPALQRVVGPGFTRTTIQREMDRATQPRRRRILKQLLRSVP